MCGNPEDNLLFVYQYMHCDDRLETVVSANRSILPDLCKS